MVELARENKNNGDEQPQARCASYQECEQRPTSKHHKPCDAFSRAQHLPTAKRGKKIGPNEHSSCRV